MRELKRRLGQYLLPVERAPIDQLKPVRRGTLNGFNDAVQMGSNDAPFYFVLTERSPKPVAKVLVEQNFHSFGCFRLV